MENSGYMNAKVAERSILLSEQDSLEGNTLVSIETCDDLEKDNISVFIQENFGQFLKYITMLPKLEQDLLLSYYICHRAQNHVAPLFGLTQTMASFRLRMGLRALAFYIMFEGVPNEPLLCKTLKSIGHEFITLDTKDTIFTSKIVGEKGFLLSKILLDYNQSKSFAVIAQRLSVHRPDLRRKLRALALELETGSFLAMAVSGWMCVMLDHADCAGAGKNQQYKTRLQPIERSDPAIVGEFRISVTDQDFDQHALLPHSNF